MLANPVFPLVTFLVTIVLAEVAPHRHGLVEYWGQNSGLNQQRLRYYCDKEYVDFVVLAFVNGFPDLKINFSNMCGDTFPSGLLNCPEIGEDIKYCRARGKIVLLSLGGASGSYGFKDNQEAKDFAKVLYNTFGPGHAEERPFGDAIVNGYDLDMEASSVGYAALASELNTLHEDINDYVLTVTPQCPYPDAALGKVLTDVFVHAVFIQFYNNYCELQRGNFNLMEHWKNYAENESPNKKVLLFVGLPGSQKSASTGYANIEEVKAKITPDIIKYEHFGGFMLWDASSSDGNRDANDKPFDKQLAEFLAEHTNDT